MDDNNIIQLYHSEQIDGVDGGEVLSDIDDDVEANPADCDSDDDL